MTDAPSRAGELSLVGNALALDFANTSSGRGGANALEHLRTHEHLLLWARHAGALIDRGKGRGGKKNPLLPEASRRRALAEALELREAIHSAVAGIAAGQGVGAGELATIVRYHAACLATAELAPLGGRHGWRWPKDTALLGKVSLSAVEILTSADPARLRQCPGEDCGWVFLDTSKAGRRRWCEMEVCGNRAKARRLTARRRGLA